MMRGTAELPPSHCSEGGSALLGLHWLPRCDWCSCQAQFLLAARVHATCGAAGRSVCIPEAAAVAGSWSRCAWCPLSPRRPLAAPQLPRRTSVSAMCLPPAPTPHALHCCQWASLAAAELACEFHCIYKDVVLICWGLQILLIQVPQLQQAHTGALAGQEHQTSYTACYSCWSEEGSGALHACAAACPVRSGQRDSSFVQRYVTM